jgi:hypothetical protein
MATFEELAATVRAGLAEAFAGKTVDADRAEYVMCGLAKMEAANYGYDINNYTIPEDFQGLAGDYILRITEQAWTTWDQHLSQQ